MEVFAGFKAYLERSGKRLDDSDLMMGATVLSCGYWVVANNERHFRPIPGLGIDDWTKFQPLL